MVMSKSQDDAAMKHILEEVFDEDDGSELHQALKLYGIDSPQAICNCEEHEFYLLTYPVDEFSHDYLHLGYVVRLSTFKAFISHQNSIGIEVKDNDWTSISS